MKKLLELLGTIIITTNAIAPLVANKSNENSNKNKKNLEILNRKKRQTPTPSIKQNQNQNQEQSGVKNNNQNVKNNFIEKEIILNKNYSDNIQKMLQELINENHLNPLRTFDLGGLISNNIGNTQTLYSTLDLLTPQMSKWAKEQEKKNWQKILILTLKNKKDKNNDEDKKIKLVINLEDFYVLGFINEYKDKDKNNNNQKQYFYFDDQLEKVNTKRIKNLENQINILKQVDSNENKDEIKAKENKINKLNSKAEKLKIQAQQKKLQKINKELPKELVGEKINLDYTADYPDYGLNVIIKNFGQPDKGKEDITISQFTLNKAIENLATYTKEQNEESKKLKELENSPHPYTKETDLKIKIKELQKIKDDLVRIIFVTSEAMRFQCDEKTLETYAKFKINEELTADEIEKLNEKKEELEKIKKSKRSNLTNNLEKLQKEEKEKITYQFIQEWNKEIKKFTKDEIKDLIVKINSWQGLKNKLEIDEDNKELKEYYKKNKIKLDKKIKNSNLINFLKDDNWDGLIKKINTSDNEKEKITTQIIQIQEITTEIKKIEEKLDNNELQKIIKESKNILKDIQKLFQDQDQEKKWADYTLQIRGGWKKYSEILPKFRIKIWDDLIKIKLLNNLICIQIKLFNNLICSNKDNLKDYQFLNKILKTKNNDNTFETILKTKLKTILEKWFNKNQNLNFNKDDFLNLKTDFVNETTNLIKIIMNPNLKTLDTLSSKFISEQIGITKLKKIVEQTTNIGSEQTQTNEKKINDIKSIIDNCFENKSIIDNFVENDTNLLTLFIIQNNLDMVKLLLYLNKNPEVINSYSKGLSPLHYAAQNGYLEILCELLKNKDINVNILDNNGKGSQTPLYYAIMMNNIKIVKELLTNKNSKNKIEINKVSKNGLSPLHCATFFGYTEIIKLLLEHGFNVNLQNDNGLSPLHLAAVKGPTEVIKLLLEHGADINKTINKYATPLHLAAQNGHIAVVKLLLNYLLEQLEQRKITFDNLNNNVKTALSISKDTKQTKIQDLLEKINRLNELKLIAKTRKKQKEYIDKIKELLRIQLSDVITQTDLDEIADNSDETILNHLTKLNPQLDISQVKVQKNSITATTAIIINNKNYYSGKVEVIFTTPEEVTSVNKKQSNSSNHDNQDGGGSTNKNNNPRNPDTKNGNVDGDNEKTITQEKYKEQGARPKGSRIISNQSPTKNNNLNNSLDKNSGGSSTQQQKPNQREQTNQYDVRSDGSCLFWAVATPYLLSVIDNNEKFENRFIQLFGKNELNELQHIKKLLQQFDLENHSNTQLWYDDPTAQNLITNVFRNRVVDYIENNLDNPTQHNSNGNQAESFRTSIQLENENQININSYLKRMRGINEWGGQIEILAIGNILNININANNIAIFETTSNENIELFYVESEKGSNKNHYNFAISEQISSTNFKNQFTNNNNNQNTKQNLPQNLSKVITQTNLGEIPDNNSQTILNRIAELNPIININYLKVELKSITEDSALIISNDENIYNGNVIVTFKLTKQKNQTIKNDHEQHHQISYNKDDHDDSDNGNSNANNDYNSNTPASNDDISLQNAVFLGQTDIVKKILKEPNINVNVKDNDGLSPLHYAVITNHPTIVKLLLSYPKINVNVKDNDGDTPLHQAALENYIEIIKLLLSNGAKINEINNLYKTPVDNAKAVGNKEVQNILENFIKLNDNINKYNDLSKKEKQQKLDEINEHYQTLSQNEQKNFKEKLATIGTSAIGAGISVIGTKITVSGSVISNAVTTTNEAIEMTPLLSEESLMAAETLSVAGETAVVATEGTIIGSEAATASALAPETLGLSLVIGGLAIAGTAIIWWLSDHDNTQQAVKNQSHNQYNEIEKYYKFLAHDQLKLDIDINEWNKIKQIYQENTNSYQEFKNKVKSEINNFHKEDHSGWGGSINDNDINILIKIIYNHFQEINNHFSSNSNNRLKIITNTVGNYFIIKEE